MTFFELVEAAAAKRASDIHLSVDEPVLFRIDGRLMPQGEALAARAVETLVREVVTEAQWKRFQQDKELDFAYEDRARRLRMNLHVARGRVALAARMIRATLPTFQEI